MATILAHLEIKPGKEAQWEAIMADMVRQTFEQEEQVFGTSISKPPSRCTTIACSRPRTRGRFTFIRPRITMRGMTLRTCRPALSWNILVPFKAPVNFHRQRTPRYLQAPAMRCAILKRCFRF